MSRSRSALRITLSLFAFVLLGMHASQVQAQRPGSAVPYSPRHLPVVGGALDLARGGGFSGTGALTSIGARAHLTFGTAWQVTGGAAFVHADEDALDNGVSLFGTVALQLREARPTLAMNVQTGFAWTRIPASSGSIRMVDVPLGVGWSLFAPSPIGPVELWAAPRIQLRHVSSSVETGNADATRLGAGASAGLSYTHASTQLGFGLSGDVLVIEDPEDAEIAVKGAITLTLHLLRLR